MVCVTHQEKLFTLAKEAWQYGVPFPRSQVWHTHIPSHKEYQYYYRGKCFSVKKILACKNGTVKKSRNKAEMKPQRWWWRRDTRRAFYIYSTYHHDQASSPKVHAKTSFPKEGSMKLYKLNTPTFDGDILNWSTFWEQFSTTIDEKATCNLSSTFVECCTG